MKTTYSWCGLTGRKSLWARSIQPKFPEISVQNSMDRFGPTGKVSKKQVHLLRWSSFPGRTGLNVGWMDRALFKTNLTGVPSLTSPPPSLLFFRAPFYFAPLPTIWTPGTGYVLRRGYSPLEFNSKKFADIWQVDRTLVEDWRWSLKQSEFTFYKCDFLSCNGSRGCLSSLPNSATSLTMFRQLLNVITN